MLVSPTATWAVRPEVRRVLIPMSDDNALIALDWAVMLCGRRITPLSVIEDRECLRLSQERRYEATHATLHLGVGQVDRD
jgi:hypothetical protein